jgi:hypothetical protein
MKLIYARAYEMIGVSPMQMALLRPIKYIGLSLRGIKRVNNLALLYTRQNYAVTPLSPVLDPLKFEFMDAMDYLYPEKIAKSNRAVSIMGV